MKRIFTFLAAVLITVSVFAQSPQKMSYQAIIRNNSDALVVNQQVGMSISILQGSASGSVVYKEIYNPNPQTNANGLVNIEIGNGIPVTGTFASIDWSTGSYFIKADTDPTGGTNYTITGTSQLLSVPYALHAKTAETVTGTIAETDPVFATSIASGITGADTTNWNSKQEQLTAGKGIDITSNVISGTGSNITHYVGELYGGGIVVSVWKESGVEHGLIASLVDLSAGIIWTTASYQSITVPGGATSPIDGLANSNAIVAQAGAGTTYAAGLCRAYSAAGDGGLNDWYLPAPWELTQCYNAAFVVNTILGASDGFQFLYDYWSSMEVTNIFIQAWARGFYHGYAASNNKSYPFRVRAVRRY